MDREDLIIAALEIGDSILNGKPRIRAGESYTRENHVEASVTKFKKRLQEMGIWDSMSKLDQEEQLDRFRKRAVRVADIAEREEFYGEWERQQQKAQSFKRRIVRRRWLLFFWWSAVVSICWLIWIFQLSLLMNIPWNKKGIFELIIGTIFLFLCNVFVLVLSPRKDSKGDYKRVSFKAIIAWSVCIWMFFILVAFWDPGGVRNG